MRLTQVIEALLFASDAPLSAADLLRVDERLDEDTVEAVIEELRSEYDVGERSFQIYEVAGGYQLLTRPEFIAVLERYDSVPQPTRLSAPALEVLAIIAYRQPLGRIEIEDIRGVSSSGVLRSLQERGLIEAVARGEGLGRPLLYGTTKKFLEHFGFRSLEDLPRPEELPIVLRERPQPEPAAAEGSAPALESESTASAAAEQPPAAAAEERAEAPAGEDRAEAPAGEDRAEAPAGEDRADVPAAEPPADSAAAEEASEAMEPQQPTSEAHGPEESTEDELAARTSAG